MNKEHDLRTLTLLALALFLGACCDPCEKPLDTGQTQVVPTTSTVTYDDNNYGTNDNYQLEMQYFYQVTGVY